MFIKTGTPKIGETVQLTEIKESFFGYFEVGTVVRIVDYDPLRGYSFQDGEGNKVIEAGFSGFKLV